MGITVLVADDSPAIRRCIQSLLEKEPDIAIVGEASGSAEALTLLAALRPQIVVMDMHLPGCTAITHVQIKTQLQAQLAQMIALSTYMDDATKELACNSGAARLLNKMNLFTELAPAIRELAQLSLGIAS